VAEHVLERLPGEAASHERLERGGRPRWHLFVELAQQVRAVQAAGLFEQPPRLNRVAEQLIRLAAQLSPSGAGPIGPLFHPSSS
jgi:hypothetical protein